MVVGVALTIQVHVNDVGHSNNLHSSNVYVTQSGESDLSAGCIKVPFPSTCNIYILLMYII